MDGRLDGDSDGYHRSSGEAKSGWKTVLAGSSISDGPLIEDARGVKEVVSKRCNNAQQLVARGCVRACVRE